MKRLHTIESQLNEKTTEIMYLLNTVYENQERSKLAQLIKDKPKQFIRRTQ